MVAEPFTKQILMGSLSVRDTFHELKGPLSLQGGYRLSRGPLLVKALVGQWPQSLVNRLSMTLRRSWRALRLSEGAFRRSKGIFLVRGLPVILYKEATRRFIVQYM